MLNIPSYHSYPPIVTSKPYAHTPQKAPQHFFRTDPDHPNLQTFTFSRQAMRNLSLADQILFEHFGQGPIVEPTHSRIHHGFEAYAAVQPEAIAVEHLDDSITYGDLNRQANRLAAILAQHGIKTGDNIGLFLRRSIPMVVGILAALKAGASYVPQDVKVSPQKHLRYVAQTAETKVILTLSHLRHLIPQIEGYTILAIDEIMQTDLIDDEAYTTFFNPTTPISPNDTCFIIFTSGTTGNPNGVQVTHANVCNILLTAPGDLGMRPGMKVGQILNIGFDMAAWEILGSLANGATLLIRGQDFMDVVRQVDVIISTPSILSTFDAGQAHHVKVVAVAGEPCPKPLAQKWSQFCTFYNSCGPTETTIVNTAQNYTETKFGLTIGKPTPNNTVYVLDENLQPCPIGEVGEMWAGGDCVSAGYIGNAALTNERYRPDPFLGNGRMMFRTRDLGRWTKNGELEHFGRTDDQVKIRGFRVELDAVSAALEAVEGCKRAAALKLDSRNLVGFVSPAHIDKQTAQEAVAAVLPYYCVPKFIIPLDELPMTSRGKIDKRLLMQMAEAKDGQLEAQAVAEVA